jgi:plasmid stability protein
MTIRNVPDEVHRAIRLRATKHGRSMEAELRNILESAVLPQNRLRLGSMLAAAGRKVGLTEEDLIILERVRDRTPARAAKFE